MTFRAWFFALFLPSLLAGQVAQEASRAASRPDAVALARRYLDAWRSSDLAAQQAALAEPNADPFTIADALLGMHLASAHETSDVLECLASLSDRAPARQATREALAALTARWRALGVEDHQIERHLRERLPAVSYARDSNDGTAALRLYEEQDPDPDTAPWSVSAIQILGRLGQALDRGGHPAEALAALDAARKRAAALGWRRRDAELCKEMAWQLHRQGHNEQALAPARAHLAFAEVEGNGDELVQSVNNLAVVLRDLGRWRDALPLWQRVLDLARGDEKRTILALLELGFCHRSLHELDAGEKALTEGLGLARASGDDRAILAGLINLGTLFGERGDLVRQLEISTEALERARSFGDPKATVAAALNLGDAHQRLGNYAKAETLYEQATSVASGLDNPGQLATVQAHHGLLCRRRGELARALELIETARATFVKHGTPAEAAREASNLGFVSMDMGQYERANDWLDKALTEYEAAGDSLGCARARQNLGTVAFRRGDPALAIERLTRAEREFAVLQARLDQVQTLGLLAMCMDATKEPERVLALHRQSLDLLRELGDAAGAAAVLGNVALTLNAMGKHDEALAAHQQALTDKLDLGDLHGAAVTQENIAALLIDKLDRPAEALAAAHRAIQLRLRVAAGLGEQALELRAANRAPFLIGLNVLASFRDRAGLGASEAGAEAFWLGEATRALTLAEHLHTGPRRDEATPADDSGLAAARQMLDAARRVLVAEASHKPRDAAALAQRRAEFDHAYAELEEATGRFLRHARGMAGAVFPRPAALADVQASLAEDAVLVSFALVKDEHAFATVVSRSDTRLVKLGATAQIEQQAEAWLRLVATPGSRDEAPAAALYDLLLRPFEPILAARTWLVLAPEGVLSFLPFEALLRSDGTTSQRLIERHQVSYVPSATVRLMLRRGAERKGQRLLAVGDPATSDAARLRASAAEVEDLAALFPEPARTVLTREQATLVRLREALAAPGRLAALHFACHARADAERPLLSALSLAGADLLTAETVLGLSVDTDLVVLSACDSGLGKLAEGEGVLGLVRAFLVAGAPRVVVSDWQVADGATCELMARFYQRMQAEHVAPALALHQAKLALLRQGGAAAHPAHWAAFVLWGVEE